MKPPKTVVVSPYVYSVTKSHGLAEAGANGLCGEDTSEIHVDSGLSPLKEKEVLVHELLHAVFEQTDPSRVTKTDEEEKVIYSLAPRILALIRDNAELVEYLTEDV